LQFVLSRLRHLSVLFALSSHCYPVNLLIPLTTKIRLAYHVLISPARGTGFTTSTGRVFTIASSFLPIFFKPSPFYCHLYPILYSDDLISKIKSLSSNAETRQAEWKKLQTSATRYVYERIIGNKYKPTAIEQTSGKNATK
jgi:hypothetical protein